MTATSPTGAPGPDDQPDATVYELHTHRAPGTADQPAGGAIEPKVYDGEIVSAEDSAALDQRLASQRAIAATKAVVRVVRTGATHERTRTAGRAVLRTAGYAVAGSRIRRAERRARRKHLDLEQAITTLRVNGKSSDDFRVLRELEDALERRRSGAAERGRVRRIEILRWSGGVVVVLASGHVLLLGYAAVQALVGTGSLTDTWHDITGFWSTVVDVSPVGSYWLAWAAAGALAWAARVIPVGRARGTLPMWAVNADAVPADGRSIIPDESAVLTALRHLSGLPTLKEAFKKGWGSSIAPTWVTPPHRDGKGWRMQLVLPLGVPVEEIVKRKTVFAHNLVRMPVEVWPSEPKGQPGVLDLWVADQGALSGPVDSWPMLEGDGPADYFTGVPAGFNIRGELVVAQLFEKNYAAAGVMGSGKSSLYIVLVSGAILDPLVEVDVFVLAENADYDPMKPRLRTLRTGADDDTVKACLDTLHGLYAELDVRGKALKEHGARAVSRKLAEKDARLRPRVLVIDECQALFMHKEFGEEAADVVAKLVFAARKYAITLLFATPEASTASLPRKVTAVTSCKACFAIGDQQSNDAVLGTGSYKAGISAVSLEPKTAEGPGDVGTAMVRGIMAKPGLLRSCFLSSDEVADVVDRAMQLRAGHVPPPTSDDESETSAVDFLLDLAHVLGDERRVRTAVALRALIDLNPGHYGDWTSTDFADALRDAQIPISKSDGQSVVRADHVREAITLREIEQGDADDAGDA